MITAPKWAKDAIPTVRGWEDPRTGELLKSQKISEADILEWISSDDPVTAQELEPDLDHMSKVELEEWARDEGVELDRRKTKKNMLKDFFSAKSK